MKKLAKISCIIAASMLLLVPITNAKENIENYNDPTIETIKFDSELTIQRKADGRIIPIFNSKEHNLSNIQQDAILEEMKFTEDEINNMSPTLKEDIALNGGVKVTVQTNLLQYFNSSNGEKYLITNDNRDEIEALRQLEAKKLSKKLNKEIQIEPLGAGGSVSDGIFSAHGYVTYQGKSPNATEFVFRYTDTFNWSSTPNFTYTDKIAHAWQTHSTGVAKEGRMTTTVAPGYNNFYTLTVNSEGVYGSSANIGYNTSFSQQTGFIASTVRIPVSNNGTTGKYVSTYVHPWSVLQPSLSVGPISIDIGTFIGDEWSWETTFTISSTL